MRVCARVKAITLANVDARLSRFNDHKTYLSETLTWKALSATDASHKVTVSTQEWVNRRG
jgi:hypothetical protein